MNKLFTILFFFIIYSSFAQTDNKQTVKIYSPEADVSAEITQAIAKAKVGNKYLLLQIGGNWCPWCIKFHRFCKDDQAISDLISKNYIKIEVNYSKENRNLEELKKLEYPQRFGFPVLVVLDKNGKRIHTQDSGLLESGDGYDTKKIFTFLKGWSIASMNPASYPEK